MAMGIVRGSGFDQDARAIRIKRQNPLNRRMRLRVGVVFRAEINLGGFSVQLGGHSVEIEKEKEGLAILNPALRKDPFGKKCLQRAGEVELPDQRAQKISREPVVIARGDVIPFCINNVTQRGLCDTSVDGCT